MEKIESKEDLDYIRLGDLTKLGQTQYTSRFVNPNEKLHNDGTPYFDEIRIKGDPDNYHSLKIHKDDVRKFVEKWFEYQKQTSLFFGGKKVEDFL